ncbi:MAG: CBS domain-containing protein [Candidatus Hydrogenedentota bacterium]
MQSIQAVVRKWGPFWVEANNTVRDAVAALCDRRVGAAAVRDGEALVGVFSERDVLRMVVHEGHDPMRTLVRDVMSTKLNCIHLNDTCQMAKALMHTQHVRHLIVVDSDNQYCGMLSMRDLVEGDLEEYQDVVHELNDQYYEQKYKDKWRISSNRVIVEHYNGRGGARARMELAGERGEKQ